MSTTLIKTCRKCGAKLFGEAQVCAACMLETALGRIVDDDVDPSTALRTRLAAGDRSMREFGDYELLEEIGRGGQGVVYRARQKSLNRTVALKVIGLGQWSSTPHLKRFRHEAEAAASLEHSQIVPIYEIGERDGSCYFSMKFIEGGQLDALVKREPMSPRRAAELLVKIARTVQFAHEHGILHRDIKPGNILLDQDGEPHLTDFGLARLIEQESTVTNSFDVLGTPSYMAPEQASGHAKELSPAADIYSLGAVFYQMLTGEPPFAGGTTYETIRLVMESEPRNPRLWNSRVDVDLATICLKCLEKDPTKRYPAAAGLAEDVERWLRHEPIRARPATVFTRTRKWIRRNPARAALIPSLIGFAALAIVLASNRESAPPPTGIAVLPFENLSADKDNTFLADGIQDDVLTKLAKIAGLKVISRTSVMQYRGEQNTRKIGRALRVSHVLEGSVRRRGEKIHLNAQLIDTRTDQHIWAEQYDREIADVFVIQSEIAKAIARQLQAKLSPKEKAAIETVPTTDLTAFDLYSRAKTLIQTSHFSSTGERDLLEAIDLLEKALARDPSFFLARCELVSAHANLYFFGFEHTSSRLAAAEAVMRAAAELRPDAGELHLARAELLYRGYLDYDGALAELALARQSLPNEPTISDLTGYILRRRGQQEEALRQLQRSLELDPRNFFRVQQVAGAHYFLRQYDAAAAAADRALEIKPDDAGTKVFRAALELDAKGDTHPLHQTLEAIRTKDPAQMEQMAYPMLVCALAERDVPAAEAALRSYGDATIEIDAFQFNRAFFEGVIARMANNPEKARAAFNASRAEQEKIVKNQPSYGLAVCVLALIDAGLGRKEDALREARRAAELMPVEKNAIEGVRIIEFSAVIAAWVGEKDLAIEHLTKAVQHPSPFTTYGGLKLDPLWDPLRGDPRFEKIVASLKPKVK